MRILSSKQSLVHWLERANNYKFISGIVHLKEMRDSDVPAVLIDFVAVQGHQQLAFKGSK